MSAVHYPQVGYPGIAAIDQAPAPPAGQKMLVLNSHQRVPGCLPALCVPAQPGSRYSFRTSSPVLAMADFRSETRGREGGKHPRVYRLEIQLFRVMPRFKQRVPGGRDDVGGRPFVPGGAQPAIRGRDQTGVKLSAIPEPRDGDPWNGAAYPLDIQPACPMMAWPAVPFRGRILRAVLCSDVTLGTGACTGVGSSRLGRW